MQAIGQTIAATREAGFLSPTERNQMSTAYWPASPPLPRWMALDRLVPFLSGGSRQLLSSAFFRATIPHLSRWPEIVTQFYDGFPESTITFIVIAECHAGGCLYLNPRKRLVLARDPF